MNGPLLSAELLPAVLVSRRATVARRAHASAAEEAYVRQIVLGRAGACPDRPTLSMFLFDNSGSVAGVAGNDPVGARFLEARVAIERLARHCRCGKELVAILHFDTPTSTDLAPRPLTKANTAAIRNSLKIPYDGAGRSLLGPSLRAARKLADSHADHRAVLVALTDFELFDADLGSVMRDYVGFPGRVHAASLRTEPPAVLTESPKVTVTRINAGDPPGTLAQAIFGALVEDRPGCHPHQSPGRRVLPRMTR
jgi:hypothetical protein